jgi:folate-dependent phosphoribosylglycinamide formyltransferase PurN
MVESLARETLQLFQEKPQVAVLMSGAGSNAINLISDPRVRDLYDIKVVATDQPQSNARTIADSFRLPYFELAVKESLTDETKRNEYFNTFETALRSLGVSAIFYAGFMKVSSESFTKHLPGVNVHPADLSIVGENGLPAYRGMIAMEEMATDLGHVRASFHIVDTPVDSGAVLSISEKLTMEPNEGYDDLHARLKEYEHIVYSETLIRIANGKLTLDDAPVEIAHLRGLNK